MLLMYWRDASLNSLFEIYGLRIQLKRPGQQALHDTITVHVFRKLGIVLEGCISQYIRRVSQSKLKRSPEMSWTRTHRLYIHFRDASLIIVLEGCIFYVNVL